MPTALSPISFLYLALFNILLPSLKISTNVLEISGNSLNQFFHLEDFSFIHTYLKFFIFS